MKHITPITNTTLELSDCLGAWEFDAEHQVWCLEEILYTLKATSPDFQKLNIYVPAEYMKEGGIVIPDAEHGAYTAKTAPVVFENCSAGYMQMPQFWFGAPMFEGEKYLKCGMIYISCGCRGRESRNENGVLCGKSPWTLVDLKTAIRFLRHNASVLPGDFEHIISVGFSAGGAMSSLIGVTGNNPSYETYLKENGAFMDERDDVFAAQCYCPIIDLEHADLAYEWQFREDKENEASFAGPAGVMTPFREALSAKLSDAYITYFNSLGLKHPDTGEVLKIEQDGRRGSGYEYLMSCLEDAATKYLGLLEQGALEDKWTPEAYISGAYTYQKEIHKAPGTDADDGKNAVLKEQGHAGPGVDLEALAAGAKARADETNHRMEPEHGMPGKEDAHGAPEEPMSMGMLMLRPPKGTPMPDFKPKFEEAQGIDKREWLSWDGTRAQIKDLDTYLLNYRRRMKPCTSFDTLGMDSGENQEMGTSEKDYMHFNSQIGEAISQLKEAFPEEYEKYYIGYAVAADDEALATRKYLINPMNFVSSDEPDSTTRHYRIRVGAFDADTSFMIAMSLALKLQNAGKDIDYALVWDKPHCQADYPDEVCEWIEKITQ